MFVILTYRIVQLENDAGNNSVIFGWDPHEVKSRFTVFT